MARKQKTIHYIYKTTNLINNKYYIGIHSTCNIDDGYIGSGKRLRRSIRKYGKENFNKEIIEFFETRELLIEAEVNIITSDMIIDVNCMNLMSGGTGGFVSIEAARKGREKADEILLEKYGIDFRKIIMYNFYNSMSLEGKIKHSEKIKKGHELINYDFNTFKGRNHSVETKKLISDNKKGKRCGVENSQYGTCWITRDGENKKINKETLDIWLNNNWIKGRKIK